MLSPQEWDVLGLSLRVALASVGLSLPPAIAMGWLLARREFRGKLLLDGDPLGIDGLAARLEKRKKTEPIPAIIVRSHPQAAQLRLRVIESARAAGIAIVIQPPVDARIVDSVTGR